MHRNGIYGLSLRTTDAVVALVSVILLAYVLIVRQILFGVIVASLITTVYLGYTIGGAKYAAAVFLVDVAFLVLLVILGGIIL